MRTVFTQWHALCGVLLCTGCLYIGPVTLLVDENVPPEIYASSTDTPCQEQYPELVNPLCVYERGTGEGTKVFVSATDDNDDVLDFIWWGTMSGFFDDDVPGTTGDVQYSELELFPDEVIDGEYLNCDVTDGSPDKRTRTWTLVVYE